MGWYHATQILDERISHAKLTHVVEPWFTNPLSEGDPGHAAFQKWRTETEKTHGIQFHSLVTSVPPPSPNEIRLAIISARTSDNPKLFEECLRAKCDAIFLEKPGAPTVAQLEEMRTRAKEENVPVFVGFNKNVSSYVSRARGWSDPSSSSSLSRHLTFLHNNAYENTEAELAECFERNAEGMLKNMAIHELALLVTYYGVTVDSITDVTADEVFSKCRSLVGPSSGDTFTDFDKLKFEITTTSGDKVNVAADRCGGDDSVGIITDAESGEELARFTMPDENAVANTPNLEAKYPGAMPYFFAQDPDYAEVKQRVVTFLAGGGGDTGPEGVATIEVACETLRVAEYLTPILQKQLSG